MKLLGWCGISIHYESDGLTVICRKAGTKHVDSFFQIHNIQWTKGKLLVILPNHQKILQFFKEHTTVPSFGHQGTVSKALQNTGPTIWLLPGDIQPQSNWSRKTWKNLRCVKGLLFRIISFAFLVVLKSFASMLKGFGRWRWKNNINIYILYIWYTYIYHYIPPPPHTTIYPP